MSHKSKGRKNLRNRETYPVLTDEPVDVSTDALDWAIAMSSAPQEPDARLWVGSGDTEKAA